MAGQNPRRDSRDRLACPKHLPEADREQKATWDMLEREDDGCDHRDSSNSGERQIRR